MSALAFDKSTLVEDQTIAQDKLLEKHKAADSKDHLAFFTGSGVFEEVMKVVGQVVKDKQRDEAKAACPSVKIARLIDEIKKDSLNFKEASGLRSAIGTWTDTLLSAKVVPQQTSMSFESLGVSLRDAAKEQTMAAMAVCKACISNLVGRSNDHIVQVHEQVGLQGEVSKVRAFGMVVSACQLPSKLCEGQREFVTPTVKKCAAEILEEVGAVQSLVAIIENVVSVVALMPEKDTPAKLKSLRGPRPHGTRLQGLARRSAERAHGKQGFIRHEVPSRCLGGCLLDC